MKKKLCILLAEDHEGIRMAMSDLLSAMGYDVLYAAKDGAEALAVFESRQDDLDLVLTDFSMPKLSGTMLARGVRALRPQVPVIILTGGDANDVVPRDHGCPVLGKPPKREELKKIIEELCGNKL